MTTCKRLLAAGVVAGAVLASAAPTADDAGFTSAVARRARGRFDQAVERARVAYVDELQAALRAAADDPAEVGRVAAEIRARSGPAGPAVDRVGLTADQAVGRQARFYFKPAETFELRADGTLRPAGGDKGWVGEKFWRITAQGDLEVFGPTAANPKFKATLSPSVNGGFVYFTGQLNGDGEPRIWAVGLGDAKPRDRR
jgi:hypothetical protein